MKLTILALLFLLTTSVTAMSQRITVSSICSPDTVQPDGVVLTICSHEQGMASFLQPRLFLRLFADGRAEYEVEPPFENRADQTRFVMVVKQFTADPEALAEIQQLGRRPDFQNAPASLPYYQGGMDVSIETTITFFSEGQAKSVKLVNGPLEDPRKKKPLPPAVLKLKDRADVIRELATDYARPVKFCELIKYQDYYLGRRVSLQADLEYSTEHLYLHDRECDVAAGAATPGSQKFSVGYTSKTESWESKTAPIRTPRFGGRARVQIVGILRDESQRPSGGFPYRFEISEFKNIEPIVLPYEGVLEAGWTFSDTFEHIPVQGLKLSTPLKLRFHHAARIEWNNEPAFPLLRQSGRRHITFRVVSRSTQLIGTNRWNDEYVCEIVDVTN